MGINGGLPSGKLTSELENHHAIFMGKLTISTGHVQ